ncbi:MAG TPA: CPBP family intramembrane glutamic endopeptidase [Lacibacter sp.]|nr:CPBP family intramembrane glutamic endopeptidase [Lacibacter sp.]
MKRVILFFVVAYLITWIIWLPLILPPFGIEVLPVIPTYHHYIGSFGPLMAAFLLTAYYDGSKGVLCLLNKLVQWNVHWVWYFIVLLVPVLLVLGAGYADQFINDHPFSMRGFSTNNEFPGTAPLSYFLLNLFTFGIGEETGWRGFALPLLQKRFPALKATFILSVGWALWHVPAFIYRPLYSQMNVTGMAGFFISLLMGAIVLTWLYNSTKGSLIFVAVFHAMIELMFISSNITTAMTTYMGAAIMMAAVVIVLITNSRNLSFLPRQTS